MIPLYVLVSENSELFKDDRFRNHRPKRQDGVGNFPDDVGSQKYMDPEKWWAKSQEIRGTGRRLVPPGGLEPPTNGLEGRCSIRLSYGGNHSIF